MREKKFIGWWVIHTADGKEWATERYEGDSLLKVIADAICTFGNVIRIETK